MSPREKGRYLRERGWISTFYWRLSWRNDAIKAPSCMSTNEAYEYAKAREQDEHMKRHINDGESEK